LGRSIGWLPDGRLLVTGERLTRSEPDGSVAVHVDMNPVSPHGFTEMTIDGRGNIYVNSIGFDFSGEMAQRIEDRSNPPTGVIALVTSDGTARGDLLPLADQGRSRWNRHLIVEGQAIVRECLRRHQPGQARSWPSTARWPSPRRRVRAPRWRSSTVCLCDCHLYHAIRADLLRRLNRHAEAAREYRDAIVLTQNSAERNFLQHALQTLPSDG
jgi:hypothetical protein